MNDGGVWRDETTGVWLDDDNYFRDDNDQYIITPVSLSFHIWTAYSPFVQWSQFVSEFILAMKAIRKDGDITKLKTFVNTTLGETWSDESDADKLDSQFLYARREHYNPAGFNKRGLALFGGFDMQDDRVEGEIRAYGANNESWLVDYFILRGVPSEPELWDRLHERMLKTYKREDGQELSVTRVCFDSGGHYTTEVYDFSKRCGIHWVIPTKGASTYGEPLINYPRKRNTHGVYLTMIGTDTAKDIVYNRLRLTTDSYDEPIDSFYHFPIAEWCDMAYFNQLCAEHKVPKKHRGRMIMAYDAGERRNEAIDCASGSLCAFKISVEHYGLNLDILAQKAEFPERNATQENSFLNIAKKLKVN
jgi:phage terminase large subunit GpA-like protein